MNGLISYQFKKHGYLVDDVIGDNCLYVDIGNDLRKGVIDHHQLRKSKKAGQTSTVKIFDVSYLSHLIESKKTIVIYTHSRPDSDAILSSYMAKFAIEFGEDAFEQVFGKDKYGYKIIEYVDGIDSGKGKSVSKTSDTTSLYVAICFLERIACATNYYRKHNSLENFNFKKYIQNISEKKQNECDRIVLETGHRIIEKVLGILKESPDENVNNIELDWSFIENGDVQKYIQELYREDYDKYIKIDRGLINFENICVWCKNGKDIYPHKLKAAIWRECPESEFSYIYARHVDEAVITSVPDSIKNRDGKQYTHVRISVDPDHAVAGEISLKPLCEALELLEQIEENDLFREKGRFIRDHSRSRVGFMEMPLSATSDPWFYTEDELLVEDPANHSLIDYDTIIAILKNHTRIISSVRSKEYKSDSWSLEVKNERMTISNWIKKVVGLVNNSDVVKSDNEQPFAMILTQIDPIILKHRNDVLKALVMCVLGNNVYESVEFLEPDYYSCIYANEHFLLTLIAEDTSKTEEKSSKNTGENERRLYLLLDQDNRDLMSVISKRILGKVLEQRNTLFDIGNDIENCVGNPKESRRLYAKYVTYLAKEQKESLISKLIEQEIYNYIRNVLRISSIKENIQETIEIVTSDSKERLYGIFNFLSAITVPFVILSTFFQMGLVEFAPIYRSSTGFNTESIYGWIVVAIATVVVIAVLIRRGRK